MNKLARVAIALLVVALLALPPLVGSLSEARVRERVAAIDASPTAAAEVKSFDRGWFRSTARIELKLTSDDPAVADAGPFGTLPIALQIAHGPIAVLDGVHFGWSKLIARADPADPGIAELEQTLGVAYLFDFRGRSSYLGGLDFAADAPQFELPINAAQFRFSGATLAGSFVKRRLAAEARIGSLELTSPTSVFALHGIRLTADNELRSQYVMPGQTSLSIESLAAGDVAQGATPTLQAAGIELRSDVGLDAAEALLQMRVDYDVASVRVGDAQLTAAALGIAARNVDVATLEAYSEAATGAAAAGNADSVLLALGPHLERALRAEPSLTLDPIRFRYDDEPFEGRVELTTNPRGLPPAGTLDVSDLVRLMGVVNTDAELRVSKPLAAELAALAARIQLGADGSVPPDQLEYLAEAQSGLMLTMLVGQGVLVEDGDSYTCSLQLRDGNVTLNGNPLPFGL